MQVSAELRWYWKGTPAPGLAEWFKSTDHHPHPPGGGTAPRTDLYRRDATQDELAIKLRGNKPGFEVKGLVEELGAIGADPFRGDAELWTKWTLEGLRLDAEDVIAITKLRWLRKLDTGGSTVHEVALDAREDTKDGKRPSIGCQIELTQIFVVDEEWWSFSFEAFGGVNDVASSLRAGTAEMGRRRPPPLTDGILASYPAWLRERR